MLFVPIPIKTYGSKVYIFNTCSTDQFQFFLAYSTCKILMRITTRCNSPLGNVKKVEM